MKSGIYLITNVVNGKVYVGSSTNLKKRRNDHFSDLKRGRHGNPHLQSAYRKYGKDALSFQILEYCSTEDLVIREDWWIDLLDAMNPDKGYNLLSADRRGANGMTGKKHSDETRAKMSAAHKGNKNSLGHKHSDETRAKMSAAKKGKPNGRKHSEETKAKMSAARMGNQHTLGHKHSDETRAKMSAAHIKRRRETQVS